MTNTDGRIFLSYNHADAEIVRPISNALERRGLKIWIDSTELVGGDDLFDSINDGLSESRAFVAFVGSDYFDNGRYTRTEFSAAFHLAASAANWRMIIVLLEGGELPMLAAGRLALFYKGAEETAEEIADAISRFESVDGLSYGSQSDRSVFEEPEFDLNELGAADLRIIVREFIAKRAELRRLGDSHPVLLVYLPRQRRIEITILQAVTQDDGVYFDFEDKLHQIEVSQRYIKNTRAKLQRGLLGEFEAGYEMLLEEHEDKRESAEASLRTQLGGVADRVVLRSC